MLSGEKMPHTPSYILGIQAGMYIFAKNQMIFKRRMDFICSCNFKNILLLESGKNTVIPKKISLQITGLWNRGSLKVLNGTN